MRRPLELVLGDAQQLQAAVASFADGGYVWLRDDVMAVGLQRNAEGVECTFFVFVLPSDRSQETAQRLFTSGKIRLADLRTAVPSLDSALQGLPCTFALHYDYGMGSVTVCLEREGRYEWEPRTTSE